MIPEELRYTEAHEWVHDRGDGVVRVGITDHAQTQLGDVVYVALPEVGTVVTPGAPVGEVESTKSVSEIFAPLGGEVVAVNEQLTDASELVNTDPYGEGWMLELRVADGEQPALLDAAAYARITG